jgi:ankyrin repeat protein
MSNAKMETLLERQPNRTSLLDLMNKFITLHNHQQCYYFRRVLKTIRRLLNHPRVDINAISVTGNTALQIAIARNQRSFVRLFLNHGCDLEHKNNDGQRALHLATFANRIEFLRALLNSGANIDALNNNCQTALVIAAKHHFTDIVKFLLGAGANMYGSNVDESSWPLMRDACCSQYIVSAFIDAGIDVNRRPSSGKTPLHYARDEQCVKLLLDAGADIDHADEHGVTPLIQVSSYGSQSALKELLVAGADVDCADESGLTALHFTLSCHTIERTLWLIAAGADVNCRDKNGVWPLKRILRSYFYFDYVNDLAALFIAAGAHQNVYESMHGKTFTDAVIYYWQSKISHCRSELQRLSFDYTKRRALQICIALQSLNLPALVTLAIVDCACDRKESVAMFRKWNLITGVKHYRQ